MKRKYKTKLTRCMVDELIVFIERLLVAPCSDTSDYDTLLMCELAEVRRKLVSKTEFVQQQYTISFTPAQAFAMRILFKEYIRNPTTYLGNKLHTMSNEILHHYQ